MMKFLKLSFLTTALLSVVFAFSSCDDDDDTKHFQPTQAFQDALKKSCPNAIDVEWEKKKEYIVADCQADGKEKNVWFDDAANWLMTETEVNSVNELLPDVFTAFTESDYSKWEVDDVAILEYPKEPFTEFVITVEQGVKINLYFSEDGGLLHQKEVSSDDDTQWP